MSSCLVHASFSCDLRFIFTSSRWVMCWIAAAVVNAVAPTTVACLAAAVGWGWAVGVVAATLVARPTRLLHPWSCDGPRQSHGLRCGAEAGKCLSGCHPIRRGMGEDCLCRGWEGGCVRLDHHGIVLGSALSLACNDLYVISHTLLGAAVTRVGLLSCDPRLYVLFAPYCTPTPLSWPPNT